MQGGTNVNVTGTGSSANPYVVNADIDTNCPEVRACLSAGTGITYDQGTGIISANSGQVTVQDTQTVDHTLTGNGTTATPYVLSSVVRLDATPPGGGTNLIGSGADGLYVQCAQVRTCFSEGDGIDYDPTTGVIEADLSTDAGNNLAIGTDGGLFVPTGAATVNIGCGLAGDGSGGAPLNVPVAGWPFPCDVDIEAGDLYCDANGRLRTAPPGGFDRVVQQTQTNYPDLLVPNPVNTQVEMQSISITNPSTCRPAFVLIEQEVEVSVDLPVGATAEWGIGTDAMVYVYNNGNSAQNNVHSQHTKVVSTIIPPGGVQAAPMRVTMGRGTGGATYNRVQTWIQAFIFNLA
ncbi:hypothetical protein [Streptomyces sp. NPDC057250]|uniref:hypothetical protein n=1 Tax=Streptomyces sp. NPDC057250 TaxID=3346068 RepID=UPI0036401863